MQWIYLAIAGIFEIGWIFSLKFTDGFTRIGPMISYALCGLGAAFFLSLALKTLPIGVSYAIWTGIAMVGSNLVAMIVFGEPCSSERIFFILLIACGITGLRLSVTQ